MCDCGCNSCGEKSLIFDTDETLGIDWGNVIGQVGGSAAQAGLAMLFGRGGQAGSGCLNGQVSGDEAMTGCVPRVMALFDELESLIGLYPADLIIGQANQIASIFSDDRFFDQGIGGRSRDIREAAKQLGRQRADAIIARAGGTVPNSGVNPTQGGLSPQTATPPANSLVLDTPTVLLAGGALVVLVLLMK